MINLILNELIKIYNKKSTYILIIISFIYILFTNIIYSNNLIDIKYSFNDLLINFFNEYEILIIIIISFISSNILIEEYKGTIKQLLIMPYKRSNILLSKIITMIIVILTYLFLLIIFQLIIGLILLNKTNMINNVYNYSTYKYFILLIISKLPLYIFISTNILLLSTFINSNLLTIIITILIYIISPIISNLSSKIHVFKYFITEHFDLSKYLIDHNHLLNSIGIYSIYLVLIIIISLLIFNKKDIKNI